MGGAHVPFLSPPLIASEKIRSHVDAFSDAEFQALRLLSVASDAAAGCENIDQLAALQGAALLVAAAIERAMNPMFGFAESADAESDGSPS